jgi:hypothetical protein
MWIVFLAGSRRSVGACSHRRNVLFENIFPSSHGSESRYRIDVRGRSSGGPGQQCRDAADMIGMMIGD